MPVDFSAEGAGLSAGGRALFSFFSGAAGGCDDARPAGRGRGSGGDDFRVNVLARVTGGAVRGGGGRAGPAPPGSAPGSIGIAPSYSAGAP